MYPHGDHGEWPLQVPGKHPASEEQVRVFRIAENLRENLLCSLKMNRKNSPSPVENVLCYIISTAGIDNIYGYFYNNVEPKKLIEKIVNILFFDLYLNQNEVSLTLILHCTFFSPSN